jgi:RNA polymerase sigma-70 factor (ECF subfamily)
MDGVVKRKRQGSFEARELVKTDDEYLALAARAGDHLAFAELYRRYHPIVYSYVCSRLSTGVDDVVQNVFLTIHQGLRTYHGPRFFSWAYRVTVNTVIDELRRRRRRGATEMAPKGEAIVARDGAPTPEEELIARRLYDRLTGTLGRLPEGQRSVFVLARIEGLEYGEIADLLSIPLGTVKSRMWQAVRTLLATQEAV